MGQWPSRTELAGSCSGQTLIFGERPTSPGFSQPYRLIRACSVSMPVCLVSSLDYFTV